MDASSLLAVMVNLVRTLEGVADGRHALSDEVRKVFFS